MSEEPEDGVLLDHDPSLAELAQGRDLKAYDNGGDHSEKRVTPEEFIAMRCFIWDHWRLKRRGYVQFRSSVSCDTSIAEHMFIEPAAKGTWHIQFRTIKYWVGAGPEMIRRNLFDDDIISVERDPAVPGEYKGREALVFRTSDGRTNRI